MKAMQLLANRRENWRGLEDLCDALESRRRRRKLPAATIARFAALYRAACADLALADAYQLPPHTVHYLHQLVGRAHNQLYRSRRFDLAAWRRTVFNELPGRLFADRSLWLAMVLFWGVFAGSLLLAMSSPEFVKQTIGEQAKAYEEMYSQELGSRRHDMDSGMAGFYIQHNTTIGLQCFAYGLLFGVGGLIITVINAGTIGVVFGHMLTTPQRDTFVNFVTAHGPCELTAIVLCAAAGMRLGFSLIDTGGRTREAALRAAAPQALPTVGVAIVLFFMAALIEGFLSPSAAPYAVKAAVSIVTGGLIFFYIVVLGALQHGRTSGENPNATG